MRTNEGDPGATASATCRSPASSRREETPR
jgi:hypothetical protein